MKRTLQRLGGALLLALCFCLPQVKGQLIYGLTTSNELIAFDAATPNAVLMVAPVTGVFPGFDLVGMDFRPATGELYAVAWHPGLAMAQVYKIIPLAGVAVPVGAPFPGIDLSGKVGVDFNPVADRIRVTTSNNFNYRLNPNDGTLAATDGLLNYAAGDPFFGADPNISASAYSNSTFGASATTLYNYDQTLNILATQNPPNAGTLNTVGPSGIPVFAPDPQVQLDIQYNPSTGQEVAYMSANAFGPASQLWTVNLAVGFATLVGNIGFGAPITLKGMSVFIDRTAPPALGALAYGLTGGAAPNLLSFYTGNPEYIRTSVAVTGINTVAGEALSSIDFRPATGQLYGLVSNTTTSEARVVTINPATGATASVGAAITGIDLSGKVEIDFNPFVDLIRVVTSTGNNYRMSPVAGALVSTDTDLNYAAGDPGFGVVPNVSAAAYTNNVVSPPATTLYDYDLGENALVTQNPPNAGTLNTVGFSGLPINGTTGEVSLDIYTDPATLANAGFMAVAPTGGITYLYEIDLSTGAPSLVGQVGRGLSVRDFTMQQGGNPASCMSGVFTVDKTQAASATNFTSLSAAAAALNTKGLCGPVTINVVAGTGPYLEQVVLNNLSGSSATNTVTINGNGNVLRGTTNRKALHILKINGTDFLTVDNLMIESAPGNILGWGIHLRNDARNVTIQNSSISVSTTSITKRDFMGIVATASDGQFNYKGNNVTNLSVLNTTITGGYMGIRINGDPVTPSAGIVLTGNTIASSYEHGISLNSLSGPEVNRNSVTMRNGNVLSAGIQLEDISGAVSLQRNKVTNAGHYGLYLLRVNTAGTGSLLIANNMVGGGFQNAADAAGILLNDADNAQVVYNSVNMDNSGMGIALDVLKPYSTGLDVRNNSLAYTGGVAGYAMRIGYASSLSQLDYNNYYATGSKFVYFNGKEYANLDALRLAAAGGLVHDLNSRSGNPNYVSSTDLHASGIQLANSGTAISGITEDFDGDARDFSTDIGADEFAPVPASYCASASTDTLNTGGEAIGVSNFVFAGISNSSFFSTRYSDFTFSIAPAQVVPGNSYSLLLESPGLVQFPFTFSDVFYSVFIDYNFDGDFTDAGENITNGWITRERSAPSVYTVTSDFPKNITIPSGTPAGTTRLRIVAVEAPLGASNPPCGTNLTGETEDYLITIGAPAARTLSTGTGPDAPAAKVTALAGAAAQGTSLKATVYPNPVSGNQLNLVTVTAAAGDLQIVITDLLGREAYRTTTAVAAGEYQQQLLLPAEIGAGLYVLTIQQGGESSKIKFRKH